MKCRSMLPWAIVSLLLPGVGAAQLGDSSALGGPSFANSEQRSLAASLSAGLRQQALRGLETSGESITIMAVGESGLGKTSLLSSLFHTELVWPETASPRGKPTVRIVEQTVSFDLEGVPFSARLIDTPGYGTETISAKGEFGAVLRRINLGFRRELQQERRIQRADPRERERERESSVDVVLYFFAPHRCKPVDIALLKQLRGQVSIVPVLAKADSMTTDELATFRVEVVDALRAAGVQVAHEPVAVITSTRPAAANDGTETLGREYPWGVAESESSASGLAGGTASSHSQLVALRRFLLIDGLGDLKQASREHYEAFRARELQRRTRGLPAVMRTLLSPSQLLLASMLVPRYRRLAKQQMAVLLAAWRGLLQQPARLIRPPWPLPRPRWPLLGPAVRPPGPDAPTEAPKEATAPAAPTADDGGVPPPPSESSRRRPLWRRLGEFVWRG